MARTELLEQLAIEAEAVVTISGNAVSVYFDDRNFDSLPDTDTLEENVEIAIDYIIKKVLYDKIGQALDTDEVKQPRRDPKAILTEMVNNGEIDYIAYETFREAIQ